MSAAHNGPYYKPTACCSSCHSTLYEERRGVFTCLSFACAERGIKYEIEPISAHGVRASRTQAPLASSHAAPRHGSLASGSIAWRHTTTGCVWPITRASALHSRIA